MMHSGKLLYSNKALPASTRCKFHSPRGQGRKPVIGARHVSSGDNIRTELVQASAPLVIADSITRVGPEASDAVVVNASHGGVYAAYLAAKLHAAAAIFNDAGIGRDRAGIGGLDYLQELGSPPPPSAMRRLGSAMAPI